MAEFDSVIRWINVLLSILATSHVLRYKKDSRAALGWIGIMWLNAPIGIALYFLFGINRVRRRAKLQRLEHARLLSITDTSTPAVYKNLLALQETGNRISNHPLQNGNDLKILRNGDEAYPEMIAQIESATASITMSTYIFDRGVVADQFVKALSGAKARGVEIRILIDDMGLRYSRPTVLSLLRENGIRVAQFQPIFTFKTVGTINLRNHRKSLVIDGIIGFTGGMNIRDGHCLRLESANGHPIQDLQFKISGPLVSQMQSEFARDWAYTTGELLMNEGWFPLYSSPAALTERKEVQMRLLEGRAPSNASKFARVISDGPDEDYERVRWLLMGALSVAKKNMCIVTPYFVPDQILISHFISASLRGVEIRIVLPQKGNLPWVQWASNALLWQLLQKGIRVFLQAEPFDHSKFLTVDEEWSLIGSTNIDPRSLRLNFELNVEVYDCDFANQLYQIFQEKLGRSRELTLEETDRRHPLIRIRDGAARLMSPYL
ncbi:MAG: cardiolipin synthase [Bdellovibrionales bacterium]|nr:cardiolipin synthase [Bdellovibrionales bacterium]